MVIPALTRTKICPCAPQNGEQTLLTHEKPNPDLTRIARATSHLSRHGITIMLRLSV